MIFSSFEFLLLFFPIVTVLYFCAPHSWRWLLLLVASCVFYMAFVPIYILILVFTIVVDYFAGLLIERASGARRRWFLVASLVANIGVLAVFKYGGFLIENLHAFSSLMQVSWDRPTLQIVLPIGLSFHTFQAMSYTIEVYRGNQRAERHFGIYALYVMFYPQLVAGPIERPQNLLGQFRERHFFDYARVTSGLKLMAWGLFKKVIVADQLARLVDPVFSEPGKFHGLAVVAAVFFFAFQIYYDFAGYSDMAIGSARVMGFRLMQNFDTPYFSASIAEFWRRWHISLSTWFRDYLYFPLGGNRVGWARWCFNIMVVFLVSGLWHGANWTFVVWGALHGIYLICGAATAPVRRAIRERLGAGVSRDPLRLLSVVCTFCLVLFAWVFFRAQTTGEALGIIQRALVGLPADLHAIFAGQLPSGTGGLASFGHRNLVFACCAVVGMMAVEALDRRRNMFERLSDWPLVARFAVYFVLIYAPLFFGQLTEPQQFIYFQF